ncbi:TIGR04283 family arsenosugar biosynthesis glycosyltransferase [Lagierella sp.]|uniref:TIGR04283 family arsenosugar biosynthesis glycosyltransferase n=1 Tax=Lagierella sp. TaxID=2849657 RepID=UPI002609FAFC|nr:TIGR04283 family arsenosugar biosynthesis glycosyltransferase [Lagierella sp.]
MISIIVPVYRDEAALKNFLAQKNKLKGDYELLFVITKEDEHLVQKYKDERILIAPKGRSFQMNHGAKNSTGEILLFLHCDSIFEENILEEVQKSIEKSPAGCLRLYFDSKHPLMKICGFMSRLRVRTRNIAFGDQGIFLTRNLLEEIGGFREIPIMEDYQLSMDIKDRGIRILQCDSKIITRAVRFEKGGMLRTMYRMQKFQHMYRNGESISKIAREYRNIR